MSTNTISDNAISDSPRAPLFKVKVTPDFYHRPRKTSSDDVKIPREKTIIYLPGFGNTMSGFARSLYTAAAVDHSLFYYNGVVVKTEKSQTGSLRFLPLTPALARSEFEQFAAFRKAGKFPLQDFVLSEQDAKAVLACAEAATILPNVRALLNYPIPVLQDDKFEVLQPGYNASTQIYVAGGTVDEPATVEDAKNMIETLLRDFNFQSPSDKARAIAAFLTPALCLGKFISGRQPIDIIEANASQVGKGFLAKLRALAYGERPFILAQQSGGVGSLDESFAAALTEGKPFIILDNLRGKLSSTKLESFLTSSGPFAVRKPYAQQQYVDGANYFLAITSNGVETTSDLANRASFISMEEKAGRVFKPIDGLPLDKHIEHNQAKYIGAITKILRHWYESGCPKTNEARHSFSEWAQSMDWIVQNVLGLPPLLDGNDEVQARVQNPALVFVRQVAIEVEKRDRLGQEITAAEIANLCSNAGVSVPGVDKAVAAKNDKLELQQVGTQMGQAFGDLEEIQVHPYVVRRIEKMDRSEPGKVYPRKFYTFHKTGADPSVNPADADDIVI